MVGVVALGGLALVGFRAARPGVLPGTTVAGVDVGGMDAAAVDAAVAPIEAQRQARPLDARHGPNTVSTTAGEVGYLLDEVATTQAVLRRGRQPNPLAALADHLRATFGGLQVEVVEGFDDRAFERWLARLGEELGLPPVEVPLQITGRDVEIVVPEPGQTIDADALRARVLAALADPAERVVQVPTITAAPTPDDDQVTALRRLAEQAISAPVTLGRDGVQLSFSSQQIGRMLVVRAMPVTGRGAELTLAVDPDVLTAHVPAGQLDALTSQPRDATFAVSGSSIAIVADRSGFRFDAGIAAEQLLEVATGGGTRTAELDGDLTPAEVTAADLEPLGIVEQVATFTTDHPCCQGRVTNIQRMADLVRGTIVMPGEEFSLNALVGPRTAADGFVDGGALESGEVVEQVGGGVSQFTTTLFNAVFFGGYEIVEFQPHSIYISRYPLGREATLNFDPPIDLRWRNDAPQAVYIHTSYTDTSITVSLFSTEWAEVTSTTSDRYGFTDPPERREETDELPVGDERVEQQGAPGFSVDFTRELAYVDGRTEVETYTTVYQPEPRIILVGTGQPEATPTPTPTPSQVATPTEDPSPPPPSAPETTPEPSPTATPPGGP